MALEVESRTVGTGALPTDDDHEALRLADVEGVVTRAPELDVTFRAYNVSDQFGGELIMYVHEPLR